MSCSLFLSGVPAVVDFAAMRDAVKKLGGDPAKINPVCPADLVIDHSVQVDFHRSKDALHKNQAMEFERNKERFQFLKVVAACLIEQCVCVNTLVIILLLVGCQGIQEYANSASWIRHCTPGTTQCLCFFFLEVCGFYLLLPPWPRSIWSSLEESSLAMKSSFILTVWLGLIPILL